MRIIFSIEYRTTWGEDLRVVLTAIDGKTFVVPLQTRDGVRWKGEFYADKGGRLTYVYAVFNKGIETRREFDWAPRSIGLDSGKDVYVANDSWRDMPYEFPFYSSAFSKERPETFWDAGCGFKRTLQLKVSYPHGRGSLAIVGNNESLGNWNPANALPLSCRNFPEWVINLDVDSLVFPLEYKFILVDDAGAVHWEVNPNRVLAGCEVREGETVAISDQYVKFDVPREKYAGVSMPLFSLKSCSSCGIGDFTDLRKFVDWADMTGMKFVQILPINDTTATKTWHDSYPYSAVSVYALNPIYIDVFAAGTLHDAKSAARFEARRKELNALPQVDYEAVLNMKIDYLTMLFEQNYGAIVNSESFNAFCDDNAEWLRSYVSFCCLRDMNGTADFSQWGRYSEYSDGIYDSLMADNERTLLFYSYLQFVADAQLAETVAYARNKDVVIKGDIPIGVSRCSADVWVEPTLFNLTGQAGAPPDAFAADGQNWGFPTYDWSAMRQDGYSWWRKRFTVMSRYFDAYRVDHILGFFRIWEIPTDSALGVMGHFTPALPLSVEEMNARGFDFDADKHARPYITDEVLIQLFGLEANAVREKFIDIDAVSGAYLLKDNCNSGRKILALKGVDEHIKKGLLNLVANVLFVEDATEKGKYHPRIVADNTLAYSMSLTNDEKRAFDEIYEDFYYVRHNDFWRQSAMQKLPALIMATKMLACAEDLGMIPACVPDVLDTLHILSLEVQRMPKIYGQEFADPSDYPYYSVCSTSTHDTSTLRGWWLENATLTAHYYNNYLGFWGEPPKYATKEICELIVKKHLESSSLLCILPYQDWLSISDLRASDIASERINDPSDANHYWRYRMNLMIEDLCKADDLNNKIRIMIDQTGRDNR